MSERDAEDLRTESRRANRTVTVWGVGLALVAVIGVYLVFSFVQSERARDLRGWQIRLGIVADSRAAAVGEWLDQQFAALGDVANNASVQLYLTELALADGDRSLITEEEAQAQYLQNLLIATADRTRFSLPAQGPQVAANLARIGLAGLAILAPDASLLVASEGMPALNGDLATWLAAAKPGERALRDLHAGPDGQPRMAFLVPVFALQGDEDASDQVGLILGVKRIDEDLYNRLKQPGATEATAETYLVRRAANEPTIEYLSPLADGTAPLKRALAADSADLAAAGLVARPGGFGAFADYAGASVLATSRRIVGTPWLLVRKIDRDEALAETDRRLTTLLVVLLLAIGVAAVTVLAVWRHGTSIRTAQAAERFRLSTERFANLSKFMRLVSDAQPTVIAALDDRGHYTFANAQAAAGTGISADEMVGKSMASVIGPARAEAFERLNRKVREDHEPVQEMFEFEDEAGGRHVVLADHLPLRGDRDHPAGVLMIHDDVTALVSERERRERILRQLVQTLVEVVDRRDPYSAHHSERVAEVARAVGEEMELDEVDLQAIEIAAVLMNLGKIMVPASVLTKTGALDDEERRLIHDSILTSADMLRGVEFDGPVVEIIGQLHERWDGGGEPAGLAGEGILAGARIIAVANAFVAMVSARAYRAGMAFDKAIAILLEEAGAAFDRRPISGLANRLDNHGGRERWAHYGNQPEADRPPAD